MEQHTSSVNGLDVAWLEHGDGQALVLLHGLAADGAQLWAPVMESLTGHRCLAPWARGHGPSARAARYLVEDYAADTAAFIETVIGEPTPIVGFSLGSLVAAHLAVNRPDLVTGLFLEDSPLLVLQDPTRHPDETYRPFFMAFGEARAEMDAETRDLAWLIDRARSFPPLTPGATATWGEVMPVEAIGGVAEIMAANDPRIVEPAVTLPTAEIVASLPAADLARITCPVHLVAGEWEFGGSLPAEDLERWHELIPHATSEVVEGAGHTVKLTPGVLPRYVSALQHFLGGLD